MIAVDTSVLVAIVLGEPEQMQFQLVLDQESLLVGWPTLFETTLVLQRMTSALANQFVQDFIAAPNVTMIDFNEAHYRHALYAFENFGRGRHPARLNFGDCMAYAVAKAHDAPLLFKGADFRQTDINVHPAAVA